MMKSRRVSTAAMMHAKSMMMPTMRDRRLMRTDGKVMELDLRLSGGFADGMMLCYAMPCPFLLGLGRD